MLLIEPNGFILELFILAAPELIPADDLGVGEKSNGVLGIVNES